MIITAANDLSGYKITRQLGVVRGMTEVLAYGTAVVVEEVKTP